MLFRSRELSAQLVPRRDETGAVIGYYALFTDVTALKQVERMKSEFVSTVSHELRTPLTSIRGSLGLVAAGVTGALPPKAKELVEIAVQNCERLVRLVNDILDSERMMSGKMPFNLEPLALRTLVERSMRETEAFAAARGRRFEDYAFVPVHGRFQTALLALERPSGRYAGAVYLPWK